MDPAFLPTPLSRITISRTAEAVNYEPRQGATNVDLSGTDLMLGSRPQQRGTSHYRGIQASSEAHGLRQRISHLPLVGNFAGRPLCQCEENAGGQQSKRQIHAMTDMHAFALIVTA